MSSVDVVCHCGIGFKAKKADVARGWGKSCSKSCAAKKSNKSTGKYLRHKVRKYAEEFGGTPVFNRKGDYIGFTPSAFSNSDD